MGKAEEGGMADLIDLVLYCIINLFFSMTMDSYPQGRYAVDVPFAIYVLEKLAPAFSNNQGIVSLPFSHLGKRMPEEILIKSFDTFFIVTNIHNDNIFS